MTRALTIELLTHNFVHIFFPVNSILIIEKLYVGTTHLDIAKLLITK